MSAVDMLLMYILISEIQEFGRFYWLNQPVVRGFVIVVRTFGAVISALTPVVLAEMWSAVKLARLSELYTGSDT